MIYENPMLPKVVTLCGSTRFKDDFIAKTEELTLKKVVVLSVGIFGHADDRYKEILTPEVKTDLDWLHFRKIDISDEIFVINKGGYIGESTRNEINYAISQNKKVRFLEPVTEIGGRK